MKKRIVFSLLTAFFLHPCLFADATSAVTYSLSGGRLGDNLISYLHAKWISYKYNIPLLYKPFPYSDQLALHEKEVLYDLNRIKSFSKTIEFKNDILTFNQDNTLYVITYFPESLEEYCPVNAGQNVSNAHPREKKYHSFVVDWSDDKFLQEIRECIKNKTNINLIEPPRDCISIAVHVRKNSGGFDLPLLNGLPEELYDPRASYADVVFPLKCVPDSYYIEQLKYVINAFSEQKIYVYIFTDDPNPASIVEKYTSAIDKPEVIFDFNTGCNNHHTNVLEDFFSMLNFDCLIRADSNLSIVASKLGQYKMLVTPVHHHWEGRVLVIDQVCVVDNR